MKTAKLKVWVRDIAILLAVIGGVTYWQNSKLLDDKSSVSVPENMLVSIDGKALPLLADNQTTLVYFFAPWCSVCRYSIGNLDYLSEENLSIVKVALDYQSVEEVMDFVSQNEVQGKVLLGTNQLRQQFKISGYPTYYLIDKEGKVAGRSVGYSTALGLNIKAYLASN